MNSSITSPVNLGNPEEYTILDTAKLILEKIETKSKLTFSDLPKDDPIKRKPDISKAKAELNWQPKTPFTNGVDKTINYFKEILKWKYV